MKKIGWFKRLFMSYGALQKHFVSSTEDDGNFQELKISLQSQIKTLEKQVVDKDLLINELRTSLSKAQEDLLERTTQLSSQKEELNKKNNLEIMIDELKTKLSTQQNENRYLKEDLNNKLKTISKIETTFFAQTGNKGKGELGEKAVKIILEKSGIPSDMWVENLMVGSNNIEFAIKSGPDGKFIPVDSKVLDATVDEEGNLIIDKHFLSRVQTQAKEVSKYLSKSNTTDYGILVLQNNNIFMDIFNNNPVFFQEIIRDHKIYIASPTSFIQMAWSISHILDIYKKVHNEEKIYDELMGLLTSINKFSKKMFDVHKNFDTAINTHYPTIEKRQNKLIKKLDKAGKLKEVPVLESNLLPEK